MTFTSAQAHRLQLAKMVSLSSSSVTEGFSPDSDLDENELDHLVTAQVPQSTHNSTHWALKAFYG